jgi:cupin fold WbuC family metalloprotein
MVLTANHTTRRDTLTLRAESPEVYYTDAPLVIATAANIAELKKIAGGNPRLRSRLCAHPAPSANLHEMLIVHHHDVYVRPHMHIGKPESFHLLEGTVEIVIFNDDGTIRDVIDMAEYGSGKPFFYRSPERVFHTLLITSEWLVFHETTAGPFDPTKTSFPDWAPDGADAASARLYIDDLRQAAALFLADDQKKAI